jgi:E3 SUMO-protein ligase PIAS1
MVIEILCEPVPFHPTNHASLKTLTFSVKGRVPTQAVEVRCIKLDGKANAEEPTWPDIGELQLNGRKVFEFQPLQVNSSLKKRKDEKFTT